MKKVTQSTQTWVLTGGTNEGLTKYIGESLKEKTNTGQLGSKNVVCMGITPWDNIPNRKSLVNVSSAPVNLIENVPDCKQSANVQPKTFNVQDTYLDNNHTHFFLVDNHYAKNHNKATDLDASLVTMRQGLEEAGITFFVHVLKYFKFQKF